MTKVDKGGTMDKLRSMRGRLFVTENGAEKPRKKFAQNGTPEHVKRHNMLGTARRVDTRRNICLAKKSESS